MAPVRAQDLKARHFPNEYDGDKGRLIVVVQKGMVRSDRPDSHPNRGGIGAYGVQLSPDEAIAIGVMQINGNTREENLQLPAVQNLLAGSRMAVLGFELIALGTAFQVAATFRKTNEAET